MTYDDARLVMSAAARVRELADLLGSQALADDVPYPHSTLAMAAFELGTIHGLLAATSAREA